MAEELKDLNFKVAASFHREFKVQAAQRGLFNRQLLEIIYAFWWDAQSRPKAKTKPDIKACSSSN